MDGSSCLVRLHERSGVQREVEPYGKEAWWTELPEPPPEPECHDCGVAVGGFHHEGCDMERCPHDGGQAMGDGCDLIDDEAEHRSSTS